MASSYHAATKNFCISELDSDTNGKVVRKKIVKIKKGRIYEEKREKDSGRGKEKGGGRVRTEKNLGCGERETEKG